MAVLGPADQRISQNVEKETDQSSDSTESAADQTNMGSGLCTTTGYKIDLDNHAHAVYRDLASRRVDLVGDYAGNELFLIDGDSLLLQCFDDVKLDFDTGLQMLHAAYSVENFIFQLQQRKCNFQIVFFDSNRMLCVPATADPANVDKYLLARAAIIRHLRVAEAQKHMRIEVKSYESWSSAEFLQTLQTTPPYFLMIHDGAQSIEIPSSGSVDHPKAESSAQQTIYRRMIVSLIGRGFNVALINELEFRDTKVMALVLEVHRQAMDVPAVCTGTTQDKKTLTEDVYEELDILAENCPELSERQVLAAISVSRMLDDVPDSSSNEAWNVLCQTFLLHQALLVDMPLKSRRVEPGVENELARLFLVRIASLSASILTDIPWHRPLGCHEQACDVVDFLDGRLFTQMAGKRAAVSPGTAAVFERLQSAVSTLREDSFFRNSCFASSLPSSVDATSESTSSCRKDDSLSVLPFSNPVFDKHLESVRLKTDAFKANSQSSASRRIFREVSHWHNAKNPLTRKAAPTSVGTKPWWAMRRDQRFMAEMQKYAASLTNAVGKSLEPETIIVGAEDSSADKIRDTHSTEHKPTSTIIPSSKDSSGGKRGGGGKKAEAKNAQKNERLAKSAADKANKVDTAVDKIFKAWQNVREAFEVGTGPLARYRKAQAYLLNLPAHSRDSVGAEVELYQAYCLALYWIEECRKETQIQQTHVAALIWSHAQSIAKHVMLTKTISETIRAMTKSFGLPGIPQSANPQADRKLTFATILPRTSQNISVNVPSKNFQIIHCGPHLERSFDSRADPRVDFYPDDWQRKVLDSIDLDHSVFVVAPTSAGKTFISFYAMRKILNANDDGVLVYVAPTKALVNQIAAEIQSRYSKKFKYGGKSVWAIHTRDYRINNPNGCQVLVTVPHILQIMLMAPSNANSWSNRVKRIIFDEIHSIGQAEDGVVWEQLLLMAPCPIIALSATVGNPDQFKEWLDMTQHAIGNKLVTVQHPYRYSDLRKYYHVPPKTFVFAGLPGRFPVNDLGLDGLPGINYIHPVAALVDRSRGIPVDLALEPRDCWYLWQAMKKVQNDAYPVSSDLDPDVSLPAISGKTDVLKWERALKVLLQGWLDDTSSPYDLLLQELQRSFRDEKREETYVTIANVSKATEQRIPDTDNFIASSLSLLSRLHERDALPAIFFDYDRALCEKTCKEILDQLSNAEQTQKKSGRQWEKELEQWEAYKEQKKKDTIRASKSGQKQTAKKSKDKTESNNDENAAQADLQGDQPSSDEKWARFDPDAPIDGYHFADHTKLQASELNEYVKELQFRQIQPWLIDALRRGIGVHHAGMNRKYRQVVEILFRKRFLRVAIATGTLALGINMPCKTVVFSGDSVYLTALNYRQCAGRAGRRGFDLLGNVVFQGISRNKVCRLLSSRLPDLTGHFPITTSFVLRLFTLLHDSSNSKYAANAINSVLSQPRLYMGGDSFKDQTMHHLRFSIEYLRRQHLLGHDGAPLNFAGLVGHLYYTENSSFAFHALLKEGYFNELCANVNDGKNMKHTLETLMLVMAHLFHRIPCRRADAEFRETVVKPSSSMVFLPPLPEEASRILQEHNQQTLSIYKTYVRTFVDQHISYDDNTLPLTGMKFGGAQRDVVSNITSLPPTAIRSSFVALSGSGDDFDSIHDLCSTVRSGVFLEEAVIPYMQIYPHDTDVPLNAWLLDFYKHGDVATLERANGIRRSDIWFFLNDFSLVLATIVTSLSNFMKISSGTDLDMMDLQGGMDAVEQDKDDETAAAIEQETGSTTSDAVNLEAGAQGTTKATVTKRTKVADSWDDVSEDEDEAATDGASVDQLAEDLEPWNIEEGGLKNVLKVFQLLRAEFDMKFKAMWA